MRRGRGTAAGAGDAACSSQASSTVRSGVAVGSRGVTRGGLKPLPRTAPRRQSRRPSARWRSRRRTTGGWRQSREGDYLGLRGATITPRYGPLRCVFSPRRAPGDSAGRPARQAPARTSETLQGSRILGPRLISVPRWPGIHRQPMILSRLSFPTGFSNGYRRLRNTGFTRGTRSEITRRPEKEQAFIRSMTARRSALRATGAQGRMKRE